MPDISETRWCAHSKRLDDECRECELDARVQDRDADRENEAEIDRFKDWLDELDKYVASMNGYPESIVAQTGSECWLDYHLDGFTPAEAWAQDMSYADDD